MKNEELKSFLKGKFKELGFSYRKNCFYRICNNEYLIGFDLYPSSYCKGYIFNCGVVYLPNEHKMPFHGKYDLRWNFWFPMNPGNELDLKKRPLKHIFEYEYYSLEQLETYFSINYDHYIVPLYNEDYGLNIIRNDWRKMNTWNNQSIIRMCNKLNLDSKIVLERLGKI